MPRLLYMLDGGHPWGFRVHGGDGELPLLVSKVSASGKASSAGLKAGAHIVALNGTETASLTLADAQNIIKTAPTLTIEVEQHDSDPELAPNPREDQSVPNHTSDGTPPPPYHRHRRHRTRHSSLTRDPDRHPDEEEDSYSKQFHQSLKFSHKARESPQSKSILPFFRSSSGGDKISKLKGSAKESSNHSPPTNSALTHTSFSCTTSQSGASSVGGSSRRTSRTSPAADHLIYSSSSQEAPRVSHRAASSSDLLDSAGSASPSLGRKEYRKVAYDGSTLRRRPSQEHVAAPRPEESFAWKDREAEQFKSSLPRSQNPTVTLLQKKREGHIPSKRPEYLQGDDSSFYKPSDKLYTIKREYESEDEDSGSSRRFAVLGPRKIEGVGPTTVDGVPVSLKTGVKSEYQGDWYRKMFDSLHKVKDVRYGSSGYMSEPEGYDSDFGLSSRYSTLDRRGRSGFEWDPNDTLSRNVKRYVHQPGRIEDYIPGCSSLSEKELRANPEVEYKLETRDQDPPRASSNHRYNPARMQMSKALKESGYESDSTLVFRKQSERRPENRNISEVYRQIQRGGEVPLEGLRKAAPRKPKDSPYKYDTSEVNIHYKTPVRIEQKEHIPDEELARRQEEHMQRVYEQERRKKYLAEVEDIERRRHTDNFTPLQKSPIPLNRYDDDLLGGRSTSKQVARALFGFTAQNKRELSFNKGDIISVRRQIDKNWQEGELRGIVGIFPSNYVEILPAESIKSHVRKPSEGQARARFAFQAQTSMEMSLSKGETVILTRRVDQNWYEGRVGQRRGIFPVSYVDVLVEPGDKALPAATVLYNGVVPGTSSASSTLSGRSAGPQQQPEQPQDKATIETRATYNQQLSVNTQQESVPYRALYNYKPQNEDELELKEGDIVMVMEKCDDGWYVGTSRRTSLFGTFPGNYVERVA